MFRLFNCSTMYAHNCVATHGMYFSNSYSHQSIGSVCRLHTCIDRSMQEFEVEALCFDPWLFIKYEFYIWFRTRIVAN